MENQDLACIDDEYEDIDCENYGQNQEDDEFDNVVGTLQDIVIEDQFDEMNQKFMQKNYSEFTEDEENKQEYMIIFKEYQKTIEQYIEDELKNRIKDFNMKHFLVLLESRMDQIDEQLLDLLQSFVDFSSFKELMLDYKRDIERKSKHLTNANDKKEAKEEDFSNFMKNKKKEDVGELEIKITWLPTPKILNKKTHETRNQDWKQ